MPVRRRSRRRAILAASVAVLAAAAALLLPHPRAAAPAARRPVLFVGWDGADWQLLDDYLAAGALPNLAALVRDGRSGVLTTIHPPLSPLVWTTMMTGVSPLAHGILDFTRFNPESGAREPITSAERRVPAIWTMASAAGRQVAVLGLWATWPAEPVDGLLVSDRLFSFQYGEAAAPPGAVYPPAEEGWARAGLTAAENRVDWQALRAYLPWLDEAEYRRLLAAPDPYAQPASALRRILVETAVYHRLATGWLGRHRPDLAIVYFQGSDAVGHVFAPYAPPRQPRISAADFARYSGVPRAYFAELDRLLGEYRRIAARSGAVLLLASDHGFHWKEGRPEQLASAAAATAGRWHRDEGIYVLWGPGIAAQKERARGSVRQVCATLLALLGMPPGEGLYGPALPGAPAPDRPPVRYAARFRPAAAPAASGATGGTAEEDVAKLRALGYVGAAEPARRTGAGGAAKDDPTRTAGSYNNAGLILREEGRAAEAQAAFEKALALDAANASGLWNLSDLLASGTPDRADALLLRAVQAGLPEGVERLVARVDARRQSGAIDRCLKLLDGGVAARPEQPQLWLLRGRFRVERQDCRGALADFERAQALAPDNPLAYGSSALARLCLGDREGAARDLRRSLALDPRQPEVRRTLEQIEK